MTPSSLQGFVDPVCRLFALRAWATEWIEALVKLHDLDITLPRDGHRAYTPAEISYRIDRTVDRVAKHLNASSQPSSGACTLAQAQLALAREHGFASWPKFAIHVEGLARAHPTISASEAAAGAIVGGDLPTLEKLLSKNPTLVRSSMTDKPGDIGPHTADRQKSPSQGVARARRGRANELRSACPSALLSCCR
jgi:hypothetical protein